MDHGARRPSNWRVKQRKMAGRPLAYLFVLAIVAFPFVASAYDGRDSFAISGAELKAVNGAVTRAASSIRIDRLPPDDVPYLGTGGPLILSSDRLSLDASNFALIEMDWGGASSSLDAHFFWRTAAQHTKVHSIPIHWTGTGSSNVILDERVGWAGTITEMGIAVSGMLWRPLLIHELRLQPDSWLVEPRALISQLMAIEGWHNYSTNHLRGGVGNPMLDFQWLAMGILLVLLSAYLTVRKFSGKGIDRRHLLILGSVVWFCLDIHWTRNLTYQMFEAVHRYIGKEGPQNEFAHVDYPLRQLAAQVKGSIPARQSRLFVYMASSDNDYLRERLRYHLFPQNCIIPTDMTLSYLVEHARTGEYLMVMKNKKNEASMPLEIERLVQSGRLAPDRSMVLANLYKFQ